MSKACQKGKDYNEKGRRGRHGYWEDDGKDKMTKRWQTVGRSREKCGGRKRGNEKGQKR